MGFIRELWDLRPLYGKNKLHLKFLKDYLEPIHIKDIKIAINTKRVSFSYSRLGISKRIGEDSGFPTLNIKKPEERVELFVEESNKVIEEKILESKFKKFSKIAQTIIPKYIAPKIYGLDKVKEAISIVLFAKLQPFHILLLGDPGTGKTGFLQSADKIYPKSSFGLGSGTSGAGLSVTMSGKKVEKGLLPLADEGICCIDELNLMKKEDYASLYSAMEKGFVSYDKGGKHEKFDARVRLLATANPDGGKFRGDNLNSIKRQLPFEPALLSRFTLTFLVRKPSKDEFVKIAADIVKKDKSKDQESDLNFIKEYIRFTENIIVTFPKSFQKIVSDFAAKLKDNEDKLFFDISPRIIHGLMNLSKAFARMNLRDTVIEKDIQKAKEIILNSLKNQLD
jgi:DNA replicative helicase MCM subunit Mcm2 (Cdc46/Mcm family)